MVSSYSHQPGLGARIAGEPQALGKTAEEPAIVPGPIQPQSARHSHRPNGANGAAPHDFELSVSGDASAGKLAKLFASAARMAASGLLVASLWFGSHILNSPWFNQPVNTVQLKAVQTDQERENIYVRNAIETLTRKGDSHDRALERLLEITNRTQADVATVKGYLGGIAEAQGLMVQRATPFGPVPAASTWTARTAR